MKMFLGDYLFDNGITQRELASRSGVSEAHISDIINGNKSPTIPAMCKIAIALNVSCSKLFSCDD